MECIQRSLTSWNFCKKVIMSLKQYKIQTGTTCGISHGIIVNDVEGADWNLSKHQVPTTDVLTCELEDIPDLKFQRSYWNWRSQAVTNTVKVVQQQQPFYGPLSGTTRVSRYHKKHSPTHHPDHHPIFISFFHLPRSIASSLFKLCAWQSFCTTSVYVHFGLPLGLEPSTSYFIHFFTQSVSSFRNTCPYHRNLFCCSISIYGRPM